MKVKRACWNCKSYFACEVSGKSKKGNYYCKEHKFIYQYLKMMNKK